MLPDSFLSLLTPSVRELPRFSAPAEAVLRQAEDLAAVLPSLLSGFSLTGAEGLQLDLLGASLGLDRSAAAGPSDETLRAYIRAKLLLRRWDGSAGSVPALLEAAFPRQNVTLTDNGDMTVTARNTENLPGAPADLLPVPPGVQLILSERRVYSMKPSASALADAGASYLGRPYAETDCQAFVERCLRDIGIGLNLPGSNAWYRRMTWTGTPEECRACFGRVPAGAFLFILKDDGREPAKYRADGIGNASHIGIRTADGAIHSSASRGCVAKSAFAEKTVRGGWNRVGLWDALDYGPDIHLSADTSFTQKEGSPAMEIQSVTVSSPNGKPVKLRQAASPSSKAYAQWVEIPSGTVGVLLEKGET